MGFPGGSGGKEPACNAGDPGLIPGSGRPSGKRMATYSSTLAWKIPWIKEPGGYIQSMRLQGVRQDWEANIFTSVHNAIWYPAGPDLSRGTAWECLPSPLSGHDQESGNLQTISILFLHVSPSPSLAINHSIKQLEFALEPEAFGHSWPRCIFLSPMTKDHIFNLPGLLSIVTNTLHRI